MRTEQFIDGLQAIQWTIEDRGLGGVSDREGMPWVMAMDRFFEAWVETVFRAVAKRTGGEIRVGRQRETVRALNWSPAYAGSQRSLIPDIWLQWGAMTLIVDAKYKRHWEELQERSWTALEEELREEHRRDLLQILAYANLACTQTVIACLAYPCSMRVWDSLRERGRLFHRAELAVGTRSLYIWLTAVPMNASAELVATPLADEIRKLSRS